MYELDKYKHEINDDGELVVYDVPVFAETERENDDGETKNFDAEFCQGCINNAETRFKFDKYLPPFHLEHNSLQPQESKIIRKSLGRFRPKRLEEGSISEMNELTEEVEPVAKMVVISDLIITPDNIEDFSKGKYPYLSVEINNPNVQEFSSLAALCSRPPEMKFSPLSISPVMFSESVGRGYKFFFSEENMKTKQEQFGVRDSIKKGVGKLKEASPYGPVTTGGILAAPGGLPALGASILAKKGLEKARGKPFEKKLGWSDENNNEKENFMEDEEQFGFLDDLKGHLGGDKKQAIKDGVEDFLKLWKKAKSSDDDKTLFRIQNKFIGDFLRGFGLSESAARRFPGVSEIMDFAENDNKEKENFMEEEKEQLAENEEEQMAEEEKSPEQLAEEEDKKAQVMAAIEDASPEQMAEIFNTLFPSEGEQMAEDDEEEEQMAEDEEDESKKMQPFAAQFAAAIKRSKSTEEKCTIFFKLMDKRVSQVESTIEKRDAMQFAEATMRKAGVSQKQQILKEIKCKDALTIRERAEFAASYAGKDPSNMAPQTPVNSPELEELLTEHKGNDDAVMHFAEQWERTSKSVPLNRYVKVNLKHNKN